VLAPSLNSRPEVAAPPAVAFGPTLEDGVSRCRALLTAGHRVMIGVAGGSGSGKTTLAQELVKAFGDELSCLVMQDSFYVDQSAHFDGDGGTVNFDHPSGLDFELLEQQLSALRRGADVEVPHYDFATHCRLSRTTRLEARPLVVVDGTLILDSALVRPMFEVAVFVECAEAVRFSRRLERDVRERGRTPEGVHKQFHLQVKPMHDAYVEPSKRHAHLCVAGTEALSTSIHRVLARIAARGRLATT
jgi:uridine kinase